MISFFLSLPTELIAMARSQYVLPGETSQPWGKAALEIATACKGLGEVGANNSGLWINEIRRGGPDGPWCAAFLSECIEQAWATIKGRGNWQAMATAEHKKCPFERAHGARRLFRRVGKIGRFLDGPKVGAIACWARGRDGVSGHVGIVSRVSGERWHVIEGNIGAYPSLVAEREVSERKRLLGFADLP